MSKYGPEHCADVGIGDVVTAVRVYCSFVNQFLLKRKSQGSQTGALYLSFENYTKYLPCNMAHARVVMKYLSCDCAVRVGTFVSHDVFIKKKTHFVSAHSNFVCADTPFSTVS